MYRDYEGVATRASMCHAFHLIRSRTCLDGLKYALQLRVARAGLGGRIDVQVLRRPRVSSDRRLRRTLVGF